MIARCEQVVSAHGWWEETGTLWHLKNAIKGVYHVVPQDEQLDCQVVIVFGQSWHNVGVCSLGRVWWCTQTVGFARKLLSTQLCPIIKHRARRGLALFILKLLVTGLAWAGLTTFSRIDFPFTLTAGRRPKSTPLSNKRGNGSDAAAAAAAAELLCLGRGNGYYIRGSI